MTDLFDYGARLTTEAERPLADRMRPKNLDAFVGQRHAVGTGTFVRHAIQNDLICSMIFWGPPGCGKTTLARLMARETRSHFVAFSAVLAGVQQIRSVIETARDQRKFHQKRTIVFVDEIHRFNKAQQDAFLNHVESGLITLIGATTENPSFEVIPALLSRCRVVKLHRLSLEELTAVLRQAVTDVERGLGRYGLDPEPEAIQHLADLADGDARAALNGLEAAAAMSLDRNGKSGGGLPARITLAVVETAMERKALRHDKAGDSHFNLISAVHKSLRGSDPDAAVYWVVRMLQAGEDPLYLLRRLVRFASEDVGNADPNALTVALGATEAYRFLGSPEGELAIVQAAVYLATAPKSNRVYSAHETVKTVIGRTGALSVPLHIRNAPTDLMRSLGYGKGYRYAHDHPGGYVQQAHLPDALAGQSFYRPTDRGYEDQIRGRLIRWGRLKPGGKDGNTPSGSPPPTSSLDEEKETQ